MSNRVPVAVLVAQLEHELDSVRFALEATTDKASLLTKAQGILADIREAL